MKKLIYIIFLIVLSFEAVAQENYVVNLKRSKARLVNFQQQFDKLDIKYKIYNAVDGYNIIITDSITSKKYTGRDLNLGKLGYIKDRKYYIACGSGLEDGTNYIYHRKYEKGYGFSTSLSAGYFGYICSYRDLILKLIKKDVKKFTIFEDDVKILDKNFKNQLSKAYSFLPINGMLYFDFFGPGVAHYFRNMKGKKDFLPLDKNNHMIFGAHAIIWGIDAAKKFIDETNITYMNIDNYTSKLTNDDSISAYYANHKYIIQDKENIKSDVCDMNISKKFKQKNQILKGCI